MLGLDDWLHYLVKDQMGLVCLQETGRMAVLVFGLVPRRRDEMKLRRCSKGQFSINV